jgi:hypothetical protein
MEAMVEIRVQLKDNRKPGHGERLIQATIVSVRPPIRVA